MKGKKMDEPAAKPDFEILAQYVKDLSFETPSLPKALFEKIEGQPSLEVSMEVKTYRSGDNLYEVVLGSKIRSKVLEATLFLVDVSFAGMVVINADGDEARTRIITKAVPAQLFPFMRAIVADITKDSGFPPVVLKAVDFDNIEMRPSDAPAPAPDASAPKA
jgi:preprotein translocase subunit SecB